MATCNKLSLVVVLVVAVAVHSVTGLDCYEKDFRSESQAKKECGAEKQCCFTKLAKVEGVWREAKGCSATCKASPPYGDDYGTTMNYVCKEELCNKASKLPAATGEGPAKCWVGKKVEETCAPVDRCCKRAEGNFSGGQIGVTYYGCSFIDCDEAVRTLSGYSKWYNCPTSLCNDGDAFLARHSPNPDGPDLCYWRAQNSMEGILACQAGDKCCQAKVAGTTVTQSCARNHCNQSVRVEADGTRYSCNADLCKAIPIITTTTTEANNVKPNTTAKNINTTENTNTTVKNTNTTENTKLTQKPTSTTTQSPAKNATTAAISQGTTAKTETNQSLITKDPTTTKAPVAETTTTTGLANGTTAAKGSTNEATTTKNPTDAPATTGKSATTQAVTSQEKVTTGAPRKGTVGLCPSLALPLAAIALCSLLSN